MRNPEQLMDHEYDGIQEFDNPTPGWWHLIFFASMVFAGFYALYWHGNPDAAGIHEAWNRRQVAEYRKVFGAVGELQPDQATILKMMNEPKMLEVAKSIFIGNCAACHGKDGAGISGSACVNLTDDYWKNVKVLGDVYKTISAGANNGAMPAWEHRLGQNERIILAAYVASMRAHPIAGRAPEGDKIDPWPTAAAK